MQKLLYNMKELTKALGVSDDTVYRLVKTGAFKKYKLGSITVFKAPEIQAYIESLEGNRAAL